MKSKTTQTSKNTCDQELDAEIERVKLDLLSLISHELRTPLTSVLNTLRVLQEESLPAPDRAKFIEMALRNAEKLNSTLGQLLDLSKLVSGRLVCRFNEVSLKHLVSAELERLKASAAKTGHVVRVKGRAAQLPILLGDGPRLEKVFHSIFENALRFSPEGSTVAVHIQSGVGAAALPEAVAGRDRPRPAASERVVGARAITRDKRKFVVLEVSNTMLDDALTGGAAAFNGDVFRVFSQQEGILDRMHEGIGGSLAIAAEVLRQHEGRLAARVQGGKFTLWLALPVLENEQALVKVLESRMFALKTEVGAVSLMVLKTKALRGLAPLNDALKTALFRASDTVYRLSDSAEIAVLMDDCKKPDAPKIVRRLLESLGPKAKGFLEGAHVGLVSCPEDGTEPESLLEKARLEAVPAVEF